MIHGLFIFVKNTGHLKIQFCIQASRNEKDRGETSGFSIKCRPLLLVD